MFKYQIKKKKIVAFIQYFLFFKSFAYCIGGKNPSSPNFISISIIITFF